ncbi:DUF6984 family protein [Stenotrophomonas tumulicola]|uniref:DUF6984 domain-containing protein n=1 Tax=Stenotrophomonas tumulicola TaxID=1685415 RepID=A0A7W3FQU5_9GAMM|nr:hypothetical protein [Stenotrophomonas tumulicola]MBA8683716.1 hypothetical protein [Stenotrophomonas tumulicola]
MSDESRLHDHECRRFLDPEEKGLVTVLIDKAGQLNLPTGWLDRVQVIPLDDGGMGSLRFLPLMKRERRMGRQAAEVCFVDDDGVGVIVTLNLDEDDFPFELDVWKTNFQPLVHGLKVP